MRIENKLGLTSSADLAREEERISKKKAVELFENGVLDTLPAGKFSTLQAIHKYLFEDIYDFAGKLRTVNLAKGNFRFAPLIYLEAALANIDKMPQSTFDEIIEKYVEMNIAHSFREGNGRSTRIWLDHILKTEIGKVVDWSKVDKGDYLLAMERSPIKDVEIKVLLKAALTDEVGSREVYMRALTTATITKASRSSGREICKAQSISFRLPKYQIDTLAKSQSANTVVPKCQIGTLECLLTECASWSRLHTSRLPSNKDRFEMWENSVMKLINSTTKTLKDDLSVEIKQGRKVLIAAAYFSIATGKSDAL